MNTNMKKLLSLGVVSWFIVTPFIGMTFIGMTAVTLSRSHEHSGKDRGGNEGIRDRFIGAWRLVWLSSILRNGSNAVN